MTLKSGLSFSSSAILTHTGSGTVLQSATSGFQYDQTAGLAVFTIPITSTTTAGEWTLQQLLLRDTLGNETSQSYSGNSGIHFTVKAGSTGTAAPVIGNVTMDNPGGSFGAGDTIRVQVTVDNASAITEASGMLFENASTDETLGCAFEAFNSATHIATFSYTLTAFTASGEWRLSELRLYNSFGNLTVKSYDSSTGLRFTVKGKTASDTGTTPSMSHFAPKKSYSKPFSDVASSSWYFPYVVRAYELDLVNGISETAYSPDANLRLSEAIKLAACLHSIYHTGSADFTVSGNWYDVYVSYARANGILTKEYSDYNAYATRAQFAEIFANALPFEALDAINSVSDGAIPDVRVSDSFSWAVYLLYRAGILVGSDKAGTFHPNDNIKRSEAAAIVVRMADAVYRQPVALK